MRILTGALRGKEIPFSPNPRLRPTSDKVRQAIFNMLQGRLEGKSVLDLFSGTGALGLEALSGGAEAVTFVESHGAQCRRLRQTIAALGLTAKANVLERDALEALETFSRKGEYFDIILMDPPYEKGVGARALAAVAGSSLAHAGPLVFWECRKAEEAPARIGPLARIKTKRYGDTQLVIYSSEG